MHVKDYGEVNLALGKPVTASGAEGDDKSAAKAVDGNMETRWSSRFLDNEWVTIDLEDCYLLTTVKLYWQNAYATSYDIEGSDDDTNYRLLKSVTNATGGVQTINIRDNEDPVAARFIRILCKTRNTGYGSSLWEIEIYGESRCVNLETAISDPSVVNDKCSNGKFIRDGQLYISHDGVIYTVGGLVFMRER